MGICLSSLNLNHLTPLMNPYIAKLHSIASKPGRLIIGLMSGTSGDGLDIALCRCAGAGSGLTVTLLQFETVPYTNDFRRRLKAVFAKRDADLQLVCLLNEWIAQQHAEMILHCLKKWTIAPAEIDLIASHGQTIMHAPAHLHQLNDYPNGTLQIGDGDQIAVKTGIITVADFRQKHLAAGGEGAPLAVYGDYLMFSKRGENRIMLNIGGIANFTYLPASGLAADVFSTDVGPGNTLMDQFVQANYPDLYYDQDAKIARQGNMNDALLAALLADPFFAAPFPKTTGPELFSPVYVENARRSSATTHIATEDVLATLSAFSARAILQAIQSCFNAEHRPVIYLSGGGMHNPLLIEQIKKGLPYATFADINRLKINPDAKEAVLFAVLANETVAGHPIDFGKKQGVPSVCMGKVCLPG